MPYRFSRATPRKLAPGWVSGSASWRPPDFPSGAAVLAHPTRLLHSALPWPTIVPSFAFALDTTPRCCGSESFHSRSLHCLLPTQRPYLGCLGLCVLISRSPAHSVPHPGAVTFWICGLLSRRGVPLPCSPDSPTPLLGAICPVPGRSTSGIPWVGVWGLSVL